MSWWVKDFTTLLQWRWFTDVPTAHFWEYVRLRANKEDSEWHDIPVERGSFISSVSHMAIESGLSEKQVRLAINKLEKTGEITTERTNKYTRINIVKYEDYQGYYDTEGKQKGKQKDIQKDIQRDTQRVIQRATNKEELEDKKNRRIEINTIALSSSDLKAFVSLPLNKNGTYYQVTEEEVTHYKELYPGADVEQELRNMVGWLESNPAKRKTQNGVRSFINRWLSKAQNSSRLPSNQSKGGIPYFDINGDL